MKDNSRTECKMGKGSIIIAMGTGMRVISKIIKKMDGALFMVMLMDKDMKVNLRIIICREKEPSIILMEENMWDNVEMEKGMERASIIYKMEIGLKERGLSMNQ